MTDTRYIVVDDHTLGYETDRQPGWFAPLAGDIHARGLDWKNGPTVLFGRATRPATVEDFERFRVSPRGHLT